MQSTQHTQEIRSLVKSYTLVPGLVLAIIGAYMAFTGAFSMLWNHWLYHVLFDHNSNSWVANLASFCVMILPYALFVIVIYAIRRYYKRHFGEVKPRPEEKQWLITELYGGFVAYVLVGPLFDVNLHSKVSITLLFFALFLIIHWWKFVRTQIHYLILAVIAIVLSFVPLFNNDVYHWLYKYSAPDAYGFNIAVCAGTLLLIAGLLDHWYMIRMFARVRNNLLASSHGTYEQTGRKEL